MDNYNKFNENETSVKFNFIKYKDYFIIKPDYKINEYHDSFEDELYNKLEFYRQSKLMYDIFTNIDADIKIYKFNDENYLILYCSYSELNNVLDKVRNLGYDYMTLMISKKFNSYIQMQIFNL